VLTVEYKINLLAPAAGDRIEAEGTPDQGRAQTVCHLEVFAAQGRQRSLVAVGQLTLICLPGPGQTVPLQPDRHPPTSGPGTRERMP
jgi:acyl-coenzyme A thioesterase PaaI-like protein